MRLFPLSLRHGAKTWLDPIVLGIGVIYSQCFCRSSFQPIRLVHWKKRSWISKPWRIIIFLLARKDWGRKLKHTPITNLTTRCWYHISMKAWHHQRNNFLRLCRWDFMNKNPNETFQFLDHVVKVSRSWEESIIKESPRDRIVNKARVSGMYILLEDSDV